MKRYKIFVSSTKCLLMKERRIVIDAILNAGHFPIAQEFDFQDENGVLTIEKCKQKLNESDAVILLINNWYGSIIGSSAQCNSCVVKNICSYSNKDNSCAISYTHFEYLLATQQKKKVYILKKEGLEDDDIFISSRAACMEECKHRGRACPEGCKQKVNIRRVPEHFYDWIKTLNPGWMAEFSTIETLAGAVGTFVSRIANELESNDELGLVSLKEMNPYFRDAEKYGQIVKNGFFDFFSSQDKAIVDAANTDFSTDYSGPIVRVLCFRGNSFVNGADSLWEPFIFSDVNKGKNLEFVLADLDNEDILKRRFSAFPRYETFEVFKNKYCHKIKEIEDILLSPDDSYNCDLYIHNESLLPFRLLFIGNYLYLSFFLNNIPATKSPVYKLKRGSSFYTAFEEYYERVKSHSRKR